MSKFTEGPWKAELGMAYTLPEASPFFQVEAPATSCYWIAYVQDSKDGKGQANALLIAAAPEMAEELRNIRAWLKHQLEANTISRSNGKGGHNGEGNTWAAVAIPDWDVKQKLDTLNGIIAKAEASHD